MRIYVESGFLNYFLQLPKGSSRGVEILWNIIKSYAEVTWVFDEHVAFDDFKDWETSSSFYTTINSKGSNTIELNKNFRTEIERYDDIAQIVLAEKEENWHNDVHEKAVILTPIDVDNKLKELYTKFTFRFISDENNSWCQFEGLKSQLISHFIITDKYLLSSFLDKNNKRKLDNFIDLVNKIVYKDNQHLKLLIKSADADWGNFENLTKKLRELSCIIRQEIHKKVEITVVNAELDAAFDFHDRNLITPYYIVKTGKGFQRVRKNVNTEMECYSFLETWGYDLIRHRMKMIRNYEKSIEEMNIDFKSYTI